MFSQIPAEQLAMEEVLGLAEASREEEAAEHLERLLFLLHTLVSHRDGAKVTKPEAVCQVIPRKKYIYRDVGFASVNHVFLYRQTVLQLIRSSSLSGPCSRLLLQIISSLLLGENITLPNSLIQEVMQKACCLEPNQLNDRCVSGLFWLFVLFQRCSAAPWMTVWFWNSPKRCSPWSSLSRLVPIACPTVLSFSFSPTSTDAPVIPQLFLPSLLRFVANLLGCGDLASHNVCLDVLVHLILAKAPPPTDGSMAFETYPLLFTGQTTWWDFLLSFDHLKSLR